MVCLELFMLMCVVSGTRKLCCVVYVMGGILCPVHHDPPPGQHLHTPANTGNICQVGQEAQP